MNFIALFSIINLDFQLLKINGEIVNVNCAMHTPQDFY